MNNAFVNLQKQLYSRKLSAIKLDSNLNLAPVDSAEIKISPVVCHLSLKCDLRH